ncbi:MAG: hypothetical protein NT004_08105 [Bacteroidetes bacterium]|nr:hypothetical protein [Bacteroidota bacterium]
MKSKTILLLMLCFVTLNSSIYAQETKKGKNEIRLGYGVLTAPEMANSLMSVWPAIGMTIWKDTISDYNCSFYGVLSLEYNRHLKPWISIGLSLSVNPISTLIRTKSGNELTWNYYLINVLPRVDFHYVNKGIFSMYSGVQAGATVILWQDRKGSTNSNDTGVGFAFHVNAFGMRIGKEFGAFMEWGYGFRGIVNVGISGKF